MDTNANYREIRQQLREKLLHFFYIAAAVIFFTECIFYPISKLTGIAVIKDTLPDYVGKYVLCPSMVVLLCVWVTGRFIHSNLRDRVKDKALLCGVWVTCIVVAVVHSYFLSISAIFTTAIIISVMFEDVRLVRWTTLISFGLMILSIFLAPLFDNTWTVGQRLVGLVPVVVAMVICYFVCITLLYSAAEKNCVIAKEIKQRKQMQDALRIDSMTGLYNHSEFYNILEKYQRKHRHLTVAVLDVDFFKKVNDAYGHECGDKVLINVAKRLQEICGTEGHVSRYGGEEFSVIYKDKSEAEVIQILERARTRIHEEKFDFMNGESIGISCGVYEYRGEDMTPQKIFSMADRALYSAKKNGRNQCVGYTQFSE
ncbi:MAG: diguanylate cyclase [Acetatifactor sp.]|nr:diguanylate cyclase [Acetatifactor sp.]